MVCGKDYFVINFEEGTILIIIYPSACLNQGKVVFISTAETDCQGFLMPQSLRTFG